MGRPTHNPTPVRGRAMGRRGPTLTPYRGKGRVGASPTPKGVGLKEKKKVRPKRKENVSQPNPTGWVGVNT